MLNLFQHLHQMNEIPTFVGMTNAERINLNSLFFCGRGNAASLLITLNFRNTFCLMPCHL